MRFSEALDQATDDGKAITRSGWNAPHHVRLLLQVRPFTQPVLAIHTADGAVVPWLASQADLLAEDWQLYEDS